MPGRSHDTWIIFSEELRGHVRSRFYQFFTLAVVVLFIIATVVVPIVHNRGQSSNGTAQQDLKRIGFVDESGLFAHLGGSDGPVGYFNRVQGLQAVARGDLDAFYVITPDYLQTGAVEEYAAFKGRFPSDPKGTEAFRQALVNGLVADKVEPAVATRVLNPASFERLRVESNASVSQLSPTAQAVGGLLVPMLFAGLLAFGLTVGSAYMVQTVSAEKESRLIEVVITSASPLSIMTGKLLALVAVGLAQAAVWIIAAALTVPRIFEAVAGPGAFTVSAGSWLIIIACYVTGYFITTTTAILLSAVAPSTREASRVGGWIPLLSFVPFWFMALILSQPDGLGARLFFYIPFIAPTGVLMRIAAGSDVSAWQIVVALLGVAVTAAMLLWVAARIFRAAILMRGQGISRHNLWAALRNPD